MGNNESKTQTNSVISLNADPLAVAHNNEDKTKETKILIENIRSVLDAMKKDVQKSALIPSGLFEELFSDLESLNGILNPQRRHICYVVGATDTGKSTLINRIINQDKKCQVSNSIKCGTLDFQRVDAPEVNTIFIDTMGFSSALSERDVIQKFKANLPTIGCPDVMLLTVSRADLKRLQTLKNTIAYIDKILTWWKKKRHNTAIPTICVLNKIDEYFPDGLSDSEDCIREIEKHMNDALSIINQFAKTKVAQCIATSSYKNYGIDELRASINAQSPLYAQIIDNNLDYTKRCRWTIANKIIAAYSTASATVSFLPFADVIVITILQEWMYRMLACFSIDPSRTPDTFKTIHHAVQEAGLAFRTAALVVGGILKLSLIGYLIGAAVCVTTAASSTAGLGWAAYYYFTDENPSEKQEKHN